MKPLVRPAFLVPQSYDGFPRDLQPTIASKSPPALINPEHDSWIAAVGQHETRQSLIPPHAIWAGGTLQATLFYPGAVSELLGIRSSLVRSYIFESLYPTGALPALLYALVRALKPRIVIETGVNHGRSSMAILKGLRKNGAGGLISIDLPNAFQDGDGSHIPEGLPTGYMVPPYLRERWDLRLGDARTLLPKALAEVGEIDLFFHDSDHSYGHQTWEYATAWRSLRRGGLLVSDNIDWSQAFRDFSHSWSGHRTLRLKAEGDRIGMIRK